MSETAVEIDRKELTSAEVMDLVESGKRVVVALDVMGVSREVTIRKTDDQYVCDTGLKLMNYDDSEGLKACIERLRLAEAE